MMSSPCFIHLFRSAALLAVLLAAACPIQPSRRPAATAVKPRTLELGQAVTVEFKADGRWHSAPILLRNQEVIELRPVGAAAAITEQGLRFRVGVVPQMLRPGQPVLITMPGQMGFMVDRRFVSGSKDPVSVSVKRVK